MILNGLEENNKANLNFAEYVDDLIIILNIKFEIEYLNEKSLLNELGYSKEELLNHQIIQFSHPAETLELIKQLKKILKKESGNHEIRIKHKKGYYIWYGFNGNSFIDHDNKKKIILILRNITDYKNREKIYRKIEERLNAAPELRFWKFLYPQKFMSVVEKSRETLESVIDNIPLLIYWKDSNLNYIGCNKNYALINGFVDPNHIISKKDKDLIWSKYKLEKVRKAEQQVIKNGAPEYNVIEEWILPNGSKVWYNINRMPLHNPEGKVNGILTTYEDITKRFILEQRIKESEKKYRELHEKLKAGYFEVDLKGNIKFLNESLCEIMGYPRNELLDKNFELFVDEQTKKEIYKTFNKVFETEVGLSEFIHKIIRKDGKEIMVEISVYLRFSSDGEKVGFNGLIRDITEKYVLEQKLKKSEEKYRNIIYNISDIIVELDLGLNFTYISPQCYDTFGFNPEDFIGQTAYKFIHPDDFPIVKEELEKAKSTGDIISLEVRARHREGYYVPIFIRGGIAKIDDTVKIIGVAMDMSEKKEAERKLRESEENYRLITENVNDLICVFNKRVRYEYINEQAHLKIMGYTREDLIGKSLISLVHPDDREIGIKMLRERRTEGTGIFRVKHKNGYYIWVEVRAKVFYDKDNRMKVIMISRDITERKKAEEKVKESEEELKKLNKELEEKVFERTRELKESEENFRTMAENSLLGIGIIKNGFVVYANKAMSEINEYSFEEMIGWKQNYFLNRIYPEDLPYILEQIQNKKKASKDVAARYSFRYVTKSGKIKWVELYSKSIQFQGELADLNVMIDVTEKMNAEEQLKESERKLREQNIELQKLDQLKTNFLTMVSHELKTPLISIGGYTDLILTKYNNLDPEIIDDLLRVQNNVKRLGTYIDQLMDVLKIEAKKMEFNKEITNIRPIIQNCINELDYQINKKKLNVELLIENNLSLEVDSDRISQVFTNLLSNAIKFTPENGNIEISSKIMDKDEKCLFKVKDSGIGISKDQLDHLFEKFVMLENNPGGTSAFESGSGLGLYITKGIIEGHDGKIWVNSEGKGAGTEFCFVLPYQKT